MAAADKSKELVPGVPLINPATLAKEFKRFRNDSLYFICLVMYTQSDEELKEGETKTPKSRILAVTPQAVFVCDPEGAMDRAVRLETLDGLVWEKKVVKKFIGSEEQVNVCIKCSTEFDIVCKIEGNKDPSNLTLFKNLAKVIELAVPYKKKMAGKAGGVSIDELQAGQKIEDIAKKDRPADYLSPKDIIAQNQARQKAIEVMDAANRETLELQEKITRLQQSTDVKFKELRSLESAMSGDVGEHRKRKEELQQKHAAMHKEQVALEVEIMRLQAEINSESARLQQERENADELVKESLQSASTAGDKQMDEAEAVRKRANAREIEKAMKHLNALKAKVATPPVYVGPENICQRARNLEAEIEAAAAKWQKEMEMANKLEGFFDAAISDLTLLNEQIAVLVERKAAALKERDEKQQAMFKPALQKAAPVPPPSSAAAAFDDDLLGGGPSAPPAAPPRASVLDDDLLGGPSPAPAAPAPPAAAAAFDDDLLGGGSAPPKAAAAAPPPPAAAGGDDLL